MPHFGGLGGGVVGGEGGRGAGEDITCGVDDVEQMSYGCISPFSFARIVRLGFFLIRLRITPYFAPRRTVFRFY